jgi:hypothetical protein
VIDGKRIQLRTALFGSTTPLRFARAFGSPPGVS